MHTESGLERPIVALESRFEGWIFAGAHGGQDFCARFHDDPSLTRVSEICEMAVAMVSLFKLRI